MTVYETIFIRTWLRWLAMAVFKFSGWKAEGEKPSLPKYVIIAAPHTSNWDFIFTVCLAFIFRLNPRIMMKDAWFFWPMGPIFRWLGAIPIDRSKPNNVVGQSIERFQNREKMVLVIPPAGTRKKVKYWKSGFYHIANGANVPIVLGFLDYRRKAGGFGPIVRPTGDIDRDILEISGFYKGIAGKYPAKESQVMVAPKPEHLN